MRDPTCPLCAAESGRLLFEHAHWRVIDAADDSYPGFTRVIWNDHVREMTDLPNHDRHRLLDVVLTIETVMRAVLQPDKINLASLGNQVPHLHWHVIPRWRGDPSFPGSVWSPVANEPGLARRSPETITKTWACLPDYHAAVCEQLRKHCS